jgi:hypothetical protein
MKGEAGDAHIHVQRKGDREREREEREIAATRCKHTLL